ncbi:MAG: SDR family NAD(P)-dependent oxidoreductase [Pseudomonadota bacterium]
MAAFWENKVVFITGASSGIGEGLALALGRAGAAVGLIARREDLLRDLAHRIEAESSRAAVAVADVSNREQIEAAIASLEQQLGPPDVLVANAGVSIFIKGHRFDTTKVETVFKVNLLGAVYSIGAVLPGMVERGQGHIVGVSSIAGFRGLPSMGPYSASKAALSALLEALRMDLTPRGIVVSSVHPGFVDTPLVEGRKLPFLVPLDRAVVTILNGVERGKRRIEFPWPMVLVMQLVRLLPWRLWEWLGSQFNRRMSSGKPKTQVDTPPAPPA